MVLGFQPNRTKPTTITPRKHKPFDLFRRSDTEPNRFYRIGFHSVVRFSDYLPRPRSMFVSQPFTEVKQNVKGKILKRRKKTKCRLWIMFNSVIMCRCKKTPRKKQNNKQKLLNSTLFFFFLPQRCQQIREKKEGRRFSCRFLL